MNRKLKSIIAALLAAVACASFTGCDNRSDLEKELDKAAKEFEKEYSNAYNDPTPSSSKPEPKPIDPFENLEVTFEGISPLISAKIKGKNSNVQYTLDRDRDLKNGDTVTVTAEIPDYKAEDFVLTTDSKEFAVPERPYYIMKLSELTDEDIQKLGKNVEELHNNAVMAHFGGGAGSTVNSFEFLGNVLYTDDRNKGLYFVYKVNTTFGKAGETIDYYFLGYYDYISKETDGTLSYYDGRVKYYDIGDLSMLIEGFYFGGYTTLDGLYSKIAGANGTNCTRESNIKS